MTEQVSPLVPVSTSNQQYGELIIVGLSDFADIVLARLCRLHEGGALAVLRYLQEVFFSHLTDFVSYNLFANCL